MKLEAKSEAKPEAKPEMKTMSAKFTVLELAKMMGKPAKEVLFLLQGIGVDVKSVESVLDPSTAQAILTGKTQAPRTLIVRGGSPMAPPPAAATRSKTERSALKRIKIVERPPDGSLEAVPGPPTAASPTGELREAVAATASYEAADATATVEVLSSPLAAPAVDHSTSIAPPPTASAAPTAASSEVEALTSATSKARPPVEVRETDAVPSAPATATTVATTAAAPSSSPASVSTATAAAVREASQQQPAASDRRSAASHPRERRPGDGAEPARTPAAHGPTSGTPTHAAPSTLARGVPPPRRPQAPSAGGLRRPGAVASPRTPAAPQAAAPQGALGRILKRTGEPSLPPRAPIAVSPLALTPPPTESATGASAGPHSPGVTQMRSPQAGLPGAPPLRGAGGLGRAVIAPPTAATTRSVRPATPAPPPQPSRPGPAAPQRPGFSARPGTHSGPGAPRPGFGRPGMAPAIPTPPLLPTEKRRKDAAKPTSAAPKKDDAKKAASKKPRTKEVSALEENVREYLGSYRPDTYDDVSGSAVEIGEDGQPIVRPLSKSAQRRASKKTISDDAGNVVEVKKDARSGLVFLSEGVTIKELSEKTGLLSKDLMKSFFSRGVFATINQPIDPNIAVEISKEFGIDAAVVSFEEELELSRQQAVVDQAAIQASIAGADSKASTAERIPRAPVVTVMGHVDHGKTSLLDAIRKANVAGGEAGGITQHIGAYHVDVNDKKIVFLDTPGHEAFTMMRARGAKATDIVVLVVAADDGVMPQTAEAIDHAKAAKVPIVVAINKIDKPDANVGRVKQELAEKGVLVEEFGGTAVACEISAKKRIGIDQLLEMILLQADLLELKALPEGPARGVVLEARREPGKGTLATVLVQQGTLRVGEVFFAGAAVGRVRAMLDDHGQRVSAAGPATPVEVMGFEDIPNAGDTLQVVEDEQKARQVSAFRSQKEREEALAKSSRLSLDSLFNRMEKGEAKDLAVIVKADVHGSEEVLVQTLSKLSTEKVKVSVLHSGVGAISVNDVLLASASEAIIIGFNVRPERKAQDLAAKEGVDIRLYSVIYTLTDEIKKAMTGLLDTVKKESVRGKAEVRETFRVPKAGTIAGCMVTDGIIPRTASARLIRDSRLVYEGKIGSLRRFKEDASEVKSGFECGISIAGFQDIKVGDVIEAYVVEDVAPTLT